MKNVELIFVYNANSSVFSLVSDYVHKIVSPDTYACNLCKLTYDNLGMKKEWRNFIQNLPFKVTFLHKDELQRQYPQLSGSQLPAIFQREDEQVRHLVTSQEINKQHSIAELKRLVEKHNPYSRPDK